MNDQELPGHDCAGDVAARGDAEADADAFAGEEDIVAAEAPAHAVLGVEADLTNAGIEEAYQRAGKEAHPTGT